MKHFVFSRGGRSGQAAVETAIVMPLHIFLLLGIIQMGLISQARVMAKYAAYRAVRVGVMNSADQDKMQAAATLALLPVIALPSGANPKSLESFHAIQGPTDVAKNLGEVELLDKAIGKLASGAQTVRVVICGPLASDLTSVTQSNFGSGSTNEVDFDDPAVTQGDDTFPTKEDNSDTSGDFNQSYVPYMRTKLRIQVQFLYRMAIPFANWVISRSYLMMNLPDIMRMSRPSDLLSFSIPRRVGGQATVAYALMQAGVYVAPINVSYAMRMQSDFILNKQRMPDKNYCIHYKSKGDTNAE